MSTSSWNESIARSGSHQATSLHPTALVWRALRIMGSLKITVTMFALGMIILLFGTLAQDEETLVDVKNHYFNSWVANIPLDVLLPVTIFPHEQRIPFVIPIPGGATVGLVLLINLIAAKLTRFSMNAKGGKLVAGLFFCTLGAILMGLIVLGAHRGDGLQGEPPFSYDFLWILCKSTVWIFTVATLVLALRWPAKTTLVYALTWVLFSILLLLSVFLLWTGDQYRIPDPGLRITWQLTKSLIVGLLLLIGLVFLFGKRGGNVLIHFGVGLLMLGQFIFGDQQVEERITLHEGESTRIAYQLDTVELAFFESASEDEDRVIGIDSPILERSARTSKYIEDPALPVDVLVNSWMANHEIEQARGDNPATAGIGLQRKGVEKRKFSAAESEKVNLAAAYITFRDKTTQKEIGTYFFSQFLHDPNVTRRLIPETLKVGDKTYQMHFRFRYSVKPYSIALEDVRRENYSGSMTPRDFSSDVHIVDVDGKAEQSGHIWMNNPMRFRGESFYQSSYAPAEGPGGKETTTLQVVTNAGWLIPYVSCVICGLGMFVHFGDTFTRFAARYDRSRLRQFTKRGFIVACIATVVTLIFVAYKASPPQYSQGAFKWFEAGKLATRHEGRLKPMDTVARNLLVAVSNKSKIKKVENGDKKNAKTVGATEWMLSFIAGAPWTMEADCIRIDSKEVLDTLGLTRREGHRYSYKEVGAKMNEVQALLSKIDPDDPESWTFEQKKLRELSSRFQILQALRIAYQPIVPTVPSEVTEQAKDKFWREMAEAESLVEVLENSQTPAVIPPSTLASEEKGKKADFTSGWQAFGPAYFRAFQAKLDGTDVDRRAINKFDELLRAIAEKDAGRFNSTVREYKALTAELVPASPKMNKVAWEAWYNHFDPVTLCNVLYLAAAVIGLLGFVVFFEHLRNFAFWMCLATFLVHTLGIAIRVYLSDRPPVVNLYSSAVFIGWSVVLFGLVVEKLFPMGIGLLTGTAFGFMSLLVAYGLDTSDTMPVLQAVLDTQFWLATHVICITLGYGATFFAGAVGIGFLAFRAIAGSRSWDRVPTRKDIEQIIDRICYGVICFALFFSFIGTVLGGLWGDDSWGRFWGWDPKENGALMIVLWNALLLHARWDKMVGPRGFAMLAIAGNIVTAWSWFGTNQLGIGLHSYGFNKDVLYWLAGFVASQIALLIAAAFLTEPKTAES